MKILIAAAMFFHCYSPWALTIRGSPSCGAWVVARQADSWPARANEAWLVGYLSGIAWGVGKDALLNTDNASIFLYTDNYCRNNPLQDSDDAANTLFRELVIKKRL